MKNIDEVIAEVIAKEGGYSNHPADRGGPTMWGITEQVARANGYHGAMPDMPKSVAERIYRKTYVIEPRFDQIGYRSAAIAAELTDTGVNMGTAVAAMMLQRALNALNRQGQDYPDLLADGKIGPATLAALEKYIAKRGKEGEAVMVKALNCLQGERYIDIAEKRPANEAFVYGWLRSRV